MKTIRTLVFLQLAMLAAACGKPTGEVANNVAAEPSPPTPARENLNAAAVQLVPGLSMRILREGSGATATAGQIAVVHYTGWLYDEAAENKRGEKFDSSHDRGQHFPFPLGAGRVIRGWDQGVVGMREGEKRELTIAPEMAYGQRGAGDLIPPGATLVFEVELAEVHDVQPDINLPEKPATQ